MTYTPKLPACQREIDLPCPHELRVRSLQRRFAMPEAVAEAIAELAFGATQEENGQ